MWMTSDVTCGGYNNYDGDENKRILSEIMTDWEELSEEDLEWLLKNRYHVMVQLNARRQRPGGHWYNFEPVILIEEKRDEKTPETEVTTVGEAIAKAKTALRVSEKRKKQDEAEKKRKAEERKRKQLAKLAEELKVEITPKGNLIVD